MPLRLFLTLLLFLTAVGSASAREAREERRIEYLLHVVGSLPDSKFVRNGSEYDAATAESHLRSKLEAAGDKLKTAEQFIEFCATKSSVSGKPYLIKRADGKAVEVGPFLTAQLARYDKVRPVK